jgi:endonuclease/exonuclease/phosphatase family metal-dependent hydrolase
VGDFVRLYKSFSLFALGAFVFHNLLLYFLAENSFILLLLSPLSELRWLFLFFIVGFVPIALYGQDRKNNLLRIFSVGLWLLFFFYYVFFAAFAYLAWLMLFVFVLLIVFLYRRRLRLNLLTMLAVLSLSLYLSNFGHLLINQVSFRSPGQLRIASVNLGSGAEADRIALIKGIVAETNPDMICLQEINRMDKRWLRDDFSTSYPFQHLPPSWGYGYQGGAVLSRVPILERLNQSVKESDMIINRTAVQISDSLRIAIYNVHLISNGKGFRSLGTKNLSLKEIVEIERSNYIIRRYESAELLRFAANDSLDRVLIGDFNDVVDSRVHDEFSASYGSAWRQAGTNHLLTFGHSFVKQFGNRLGILHFQPFAFLGIDHAFVSPGLRAVRFEVLPVLISDHKPIVLDMVIDDEERR